MNQIAFVVGIAAVIIYLLGYQQKTRKLFLMNIIRYIVKLARLILFRNIRTEPRCII